MKRFSLQEYLANPSQKIVTRDCKPVRILCTDANGDYPIVGLIHYTNGDEREVPENYTENGSYDISNEENQRDLFFAPEKKEGWVNLFRYNEGGIFARFYEKEEDAIEGISKIFNKHIATIKLEWEE